MKNRKKLISGCLLGIVGIACLRYIVKNEKDKKYPVERYWDEQEEKQQNTSGDDTQTDCDAEEKDVTHSVTIDNITYEFVDCDMIEDTEIEMQTRYPAEFFVDSALPDANYQTDLLWDYEKMYEEIPELEDIKEIVLNPYNYTEEEYNALTDPYARQDAGDKYRIEGHPKSRYYFVKMRIENESVESREIVLSDLYLIQTNRAKSYAVTTDNIIYFDKTQYVENPDRLSWFTWYTMKPKEVLECVIGYEIDEHSLYDLHEERLMYIGTISVEMLDSWVNPVLSKTVVPLYDLMGNESE